MYFRTDEAGKGAMIILNKNEAENDVKLARFEPVLKEFSTASRWGNSNKISLKTASIEVAPKSASVWLLQ